MSNDVTEDSSFLSRDWDINIEERNAEFHDDLREASGVGRKKLRKKRRHQGPPLSHQVRALIGEGNQAYVDGNNAEASRIMQEVIRIEPRATAAWGVLAQCYSDAGDHGRALQLRIMAAHLRHDADEWERLAVQSREMGHGQQALYCYGKLYSLDPSNVNALWDRATLAKELLEIRTARHSFTAILKHYPHDMAVLAELRSILIDAGELALCASMYQRAFDHYQTAYPLGPPSAQPPAHIPVEHIAPEMLHDLGDSSSQNQPQSEAELFGFLDVLVLADLYNTLSEYARAIETIRRGCRWLQGRASQKFWDGCEDDREFDLPMHTPPLSHPQVSMQGEGDIALGNLEQSLASAGGATREGDPQPGYYPLDINARHRLAVARIKLGDIDEGKIHANIVLTQDPLDYAPLFGELADAYFEKETYDQAGPVYELLGSDPATSSMYVLLQVATCRRMTGGLREAAEVYQQVIDADPANNDAKMKLAELYEIMDEPRKALALVYQVIDSRKRRPATDSRISSTVTPETTPGPGTSLFEEKTAAGKTKGNRPSQGGRLSTVQLRELEVQREREVIQGHKRLLELWPQVTGGSHMSSADAMDVDERGAYDEVAEREWMLEAEKLVEMFRETRNLFLASRDQGFKGMFPQHRRHGQEKDEERMASRLELVEQDKSRRHKKEVDSFRGVTFDDWLRIFMQYAFILTKRGEYKHGEEVLAHILLSSGYRSLESQTTIRLALITCALAADDPPTIVIHARKLINTHQFNNEPFRLLLATLSAGLGGGKTDAFVSSTLQKHVLREIKISDGVVKEPGRLAWRSHRGRWTMTEKNRSGGSAAAVDGDDDEEGEDGPEEREEQQDDKDSNLARVKQPVPPKKQNPIPLALYGQMCVAGKSYQSAIFYLLYAVKYCPIDPVLHLSIASASLGRAMQRQADNRHHLIVQAFGFLSKYRDVRRSTYNANDATMLEVDFNFGRAFQQLGLHSQAVTHYERVLVLADKRKEPGADIGVAREAAYNLSLILVTTGAAPLAKEVVKKWLSLG
ncbi:TPR-like protein [Coniophora puteana RWD-64-598 SS2]|uniref:TPR-like protein n=1 Tax=Coniophora puteana (strain RWD-64-598) TaxID=741705 RepID=A0A5M3M7Y8_CONPW|nr:TPR-like protein [Coniophora puteana RWD-64-598 SS2]EIW74984.1 TPR-like protein [Coniophora puteana RWD-64-598 SS2]